MIPSSGIFSIAHSKIFLKESKILVETSSIVKGVSTKIFNSIIRDFLNTHLKFFLKMESKNFVEILIDGVRIHFSLYLVPKVVNRWRGYSLLAVIVPEVANRWRWPTIILSPDGTEAHFFIIRRWHYKLPLMISIISSYPLSLQSTSNATLFLCLHKLYLQL